MPFSRHRSETERPESYSLSIEIIWVSVKRDFFIVSKFSEFMVITDSVFGEGYAPPHPVPAKGLSLLPELDKTGFTDGLRLSHRLPSTTL